MIGQAVEQRFGLQASLFHDASLRDMKIYSIVVNSHKYACLTCAKSHEIFEKYCFNIIAGCLCDSAFPDKGGRQVSYQLFKQATYLMTTTSNFHDCMHWCNFHA